MALRRCALGLDRRESLSPTTIRVAAIAVVVEVMLLRGMLAEAGQNRRKNQQTADMKNSTDLLAPDDLISSLASLGNGAPAGLVCEIELTRFDPAQRSRLLPLLWGFILTHRDSNALEKLAAVGAAIRKYIAIMPMEQMGQLAVLLESGHQSAIPIELEIEVAKMIYRNFEVHPPLTADPCPELARPLWDMVRTYANPRLLLRDKHSAAASLSIQAIIAMRSQFAGDALHIATQSPYRWFSEIVVEGLNRLCERWTSASPDAAAWLTALLRNEPVEV